MVVCVPRIHTMDGLTDAERTVMKALHSAGADGCSAMSLKEALVNRYQLDGPAVADAMRSLMESRRIMVTRQPDGTHHVAVAASAVPETFSVVLDLVRGSHTHGVDPATIAQRTRYSRAEVAKAVNALVAQGTIKETRSFTNKAKKLYILAELEPSADVTGGTFYTESRDVNLQLIDAVSRCILRCLRATSVATVGTMKQFLDTHDAPLAAKCLSVREIGMVARTLELDGKIARVAGGGSSSSTAASASNSSGGGGGGGMSLVEWDDGVFGSSSAPSQTAGAGQRYRLSQALPQPAPEALCLAALPCAGCPLLATCSYQGLGTVTPATCVYLDEWLNGPADRGGGIARHRSLDRVGGPTGAPAPTPK